MVKSLENEREKELCVLESGLEPKQTACKWRTREIKKGKERGCSNGGRLWLPLMPGRRAGPWELHQE